MKKKRTLRLAYNLLIVVFLLIGAFLVLDRFVHFGDVEFTDNATVQQHITPINTRVQGFIKEVRFEEYQQVKKGDTLVVLEDTEFRLRLAQAEADLANASAGSSATTTGISTAATNIAVSEARLAEAQAQLDNARREESRYARLLSEEAVTQQQYDNVHTTLLSAEARYKQAEQERRSLASVKDERNHHLNQSQAAIEVAQAAIDLARLNLSYTVILATTDGVVGKKDIHVGQLVQPGQTLVDIVDTGDLWVVANYRETQLKNIAVGSKVSVVADAVPDVTFEGAVERISSATGAAYSLIPQDNATGNFVKVEQRIPVRIRLTPAKDLERLRAGMNVECEVEY